jgi:hypothetical protein
MHVKQRHEKMYHSGQWTSSKFGHKYFGLDLTDIPKDLYNQYTCCQAGQCNNSAGYDAVFQS